MGRAKALLIWGGLAMALGVPAVFALASPLLAWRDPVYIAAGLGGVIALGLLLVQPLLVAGHLPGLAGRQGRRGHRFIGIALVGAVVVHVAGLWITSPPDVVDALLFASPTPFAVWGVLSMWALFAAALLALLWRQLRLRPRAWRLGHTVLVVIGVVASALHALLIEGTMGPVSKAALCALAFAATVKVVADLRR